MFQKITLPLKTYVFPQTLTLKGFQVSLQVISWKFPLKEIKTTIQERKKKLKKWRVHIVWVHWYKILENRSVPGAWSKGRNGLQRDMRELSGLKEMFSILVVGWIHKCVHTSNSINCTLKMDVVYCIKNIPQLKNKDRKMGQK